MIKKLLKGLGLISHTPQADEHITYSGDHISLQRKMYPDKTLSPEEEFNLYSDIEWEYTVCFVRDENHIILKKDTTIQEAIKLLQDGYTSCPF